MTALVITLYLEDQSEITGLNNQVSNLQSTLRQYESEVSSLKSQISSLADQLGIPASSLTPASENVSVTVNGLTCQMPTLQPQILYSLVPQIVQDPRFLDLTLGDMYSFGNGEEITRTTTVGNVTTQLPPAMEVVFYDYNGSFYCGPPSLNPPRISDLFVDVPYEDGVFNLTDATFNLLLFYPSTGLPYAQYNQTVTFDNVTQQWTVKLDASLNGYQSWQITGMKALVANGTTSVITIGSSSWSWASPIASPPLSPPLSLKYGDTFEVSVTLSPFEGFSHGELVTFVYISPDAQRTIGWPAVLP